MPNLTNSGSASAPTSPPGPGADPGAADRHGQWIFGRARTLLLHYFEKDAPSDLIDAALADWVVALETYSQDAIEHACLGYLRDQPRIRPTPGNIAQRAKAYDDAHHRKRGQRPGPTGVDLTALSADERTLLEEEILPRARHWFDNIPGLAHHGARTLAHWGQHVTVDEAMALRRRSFVTLPAHLVNQPDEYVRRLRHATDDATEDAEFEGGRDAEAF